MHWFMESEFPNSEPKEAAFHVIPFPLEKSVSYMGGTSKGPQALLEASSQLEQLVEGYGNPGLLKIHTTQAVSTKGTSLDAIQRAESPLDRAFSLHAIPVLLGGEHSVTNAAIKPLEKWFGNREVGVLQFDAHMDLRTRYEDNPLSHACVMRRVVEAGFPLFQVGIRNYSEEDIDARKKFGVGHYDASFLYRSLDLSQLKLEPSFPKKLYITFDVDAFDASLMSATGTPDPGGLSWWDAVTLLEGLTEGRTIVGFDVVELSVNQLHHPSYTAAKLTYFMMALASKRNTEGKR